MVTQNDINRMEQQRDLNGLINTLNDSNLIIRRNAAKSLGNLRDIRAVVPLINALEDKYWKVQRNAAEALGKIGDPRAIEPLKKILDEIDDKVQGTAAWTLDVISAQSGNKEISPQEREEKTLDIGDSVITVGDVAKTALKKIRQNLDIHSMRFFKSALSRREQYSPRRKIDETTVNMNSPQFDDLENICKSIVLKQQKEIEALKKMVKDK